MKAEIKEVWSNRNFVFLFLGRLISSLGHNLYLLGLPWLALQLTGSALILSTVFAVEYIAKLVSALFAGVAADKFDKKKIMMFSAILQAIILLIIPFTYTLDLFSEWIIYSVAILINFVGGFYFNSEKALLPSMFEKSLYTTMNSQFQFINIISRFLGPTVAGALIGLLGPVYIFTIDALAFIILFCFVLLLNVQYQKFEGMSEGFIASVKEGLLFLKENMGLTKIAFGSMVLNMAVGPILALLVFYSSNELNANSFQTGLVYSAGGIGGVLVSIYAVKLKGIFTRSVLFLWNIIILGVGIITLGMANHWMVAAASFLIIMGMIMLYNINYNTMVQEIVPVKYRGRVGSTLFLLSQISVPFSMTLAGLVSESIDIRIIFLSLGLFMLIFGIVFYKGVYTRYTFVDFDETEQNSAQPGG
ncbi:MFS transporter [Virgibacillus xinjiangensis]|uniref:MFS transporter n=1 Tax=Virgibacillus xinjiangensis TaxID=393090 RepID=A0ABV7CTN7_9BACI